MILLPLLLFFAGDALMSQTVAQWADELQEVRQEMENSIVTQQDGPTITLEQCIENAHEAAYVHKYRRTRRR